MGSIDHATCVSAFKLGKWEGVLGPTRAPSPPPPLLLSLIMTRDRFRPLQGVARKLERK